MRFSRVGTSTDRYFSRVPEIVTVQDQEIGDSTFYIDISVVTLHLLAFANVTVLGWYAFDVQVARPFLLIRRHSDGQCVHTRTLYMLREKRSVCSLSHTSEA